MAMNTRGLRGNAPLGWLRAAIGIFIIVSCLRAWMPVPILDKAEAQIPDAGLQRKQALEATHQTNLLLMEIRDLLAKGPLNVRIAGADNSAGPHPPRATGP